MSTPILPVAGKEADAGRRIKTGAKEYVCAYFDAGTLSPSTIAEGTCLILGCDTGTGGLNPIVIAPIKAAVYETMVVSRAAQTVAGWYWFQVRGVCNVLCNGTGAIAKGDYLQLYETADNLIVDHASIRSVYSRATALVAWATGSDALKSCYLLGDRATTDGA